MEGICEKWLLEEKNSNQRVTRSMKNFDEFIRVLGLSDPPLANAQYTWSDL